MKGRILGIDPGLQTTGFGVVEVDGRELAYVASGTISTPRRRSGDLPARLKIIFDGVREVGRALPAAGASVEIVFVNVNPQSTLLLGQARGAALAALVSGGLPVAEYTALQMKKAIVGHGLPSKAQVQEMVMRLLQAARPARQGCRRCAGAGHHPRACRRVVGGDRTVHRPRAAPACAVRQAAERIDRGDAP